MTTIDWQHVWIPQPLRWGAEQCLEFGQEPLHGWALFWACLMNSIEAQLGNLPPRPLCHLGLSSGRSSRSSLFAFHFPSVWRCLCQKLAFCLRFFGFFFFLFFFPVSLSKSSSPSTNGYWVACVQMCLYPDVPCYTPSIASLLVLTALSP